MTSSTPDSELKARHRTMWASGDYPSRSRRSSCRWPLAVSDHQVAEPQNLRVLSNPLLEPLLV
jgi:hypothetical protein